jgi:NTE family protein
MHAFRRFIRGVLVLVVVLVMAACSAPLVREAEVQVAPPVAAPAAQPIPPRIALALGGGAARGFAHVGVLQVLEEAAIPVDIIVGTSAGSVVAALHASGLSGAALEKAALGMDETALTDWMFPLINRGMIRGEALANYINKQVAGRPLQALNKPIGVVAATLGSGAPIVFRSGNTGLAVRASSAVPGVFMPVAIGDKEYVDGGLVAPVPARFAREMGGELVIAVNISSPPSATPATDTPGLMLQTFSIMGQQLSVHELAAADVIVVPQLAGVGAADFKSRKQAIDAGRVAMQRELPRLRALIAQKTKKAQ